MARITEKEYEVHYYESNYRLECTITAIMNYFSDIGTKQSEELGGGIEALTARRLTWVFYKYDIRVKRFPKYGEKIKVSTTALAFKKFYASRKYEIFDTSGERIVEGEGIFLLIDIDKRKAVRIPEDQYEVYGVDKENALDIKITKLEKLKEEMFSKNFYTRYSDIDSNKHVNNSKYLEWAIETIPLEMALNYQLKEISIIFEKECSYGIQIKASTEIRETNEGLLALHKIEDSNGKELTILTTKWSRMNSNK